MKFRRFLEGPGNLRIAQVMKIDENGETTTLGYEVYEGEIRIGQPVSTLAQAVIIVHRRIQQLKQVVEEPEDIDFCDDNGPRGP